MTVPFKPHNAANNLRRLAVEIPLLFSICFLMFCSLPSRVHAEVQEYRVKAAFLYNFANFVEWPSGSFQSDTAPIVIGVFGQDELFEVLTSANLKPIRGREVVARLCEDLKDLAKCHMVFIDRSQTDNFQKILAEIGTRSILTVSDMEGFTEKGGIISFVDKDFQVRFGINLKAARKCNLTVSSKLLNLAVTVIGTSPDGNR